MNVQRCSDSPPGGRKLTVEDGTVTDADGPKLELLAGRLSEEELMWAGGLACYSLAWTEFAPGSRLWHEEE